LDHSIKVAVIRSDRRRGAVAEALALLAPELSERVGLDSAPVLIPDLATPGRPWACTHRDTLSATVDAVLAAGAASVQIVGGSETPEDPSRDVVHRLGYRGELWGRPAEFLALDPSSGPWSPIRWIGVEGEPLAARIDARAAGSRCRISLAVARSHETFRVGLGLANLAGCLHPNDRAALGLGQRPGTPGWTGGNGLLALLHSGRGGLVASWLALRTVAGGMRLTSREMRRLESVAMATERLVALAAFLRPAISLVDGFSAMQGEGPRHGRRVGLGTVVAGTDPVAVDAVAASLLGFEPMEIAVLREAHRLGLGTADLSQIDLLGDPPGRARRKITRHSSDPLLKLARHSRVRPASPPRPHFGWSGAHLRENADAHRV
jgi:uncharacterized protein (DUF362 family)